MEAPGAPQHCTSCGAPLELAVAGQTLCDRCQGLIAPEEASALRGTEVAGFEIVRELGAGRFSTSWLARDSHGAPVVLKFLRSYASDGASVQRFLEEAQRISRSGALDHPHLAQLLTAGVTLANALIVVYRSGGERTLSDELRVHGRFAVPRTLELCAQLAEGLEAMHRSRLLHLDLKPANVALAQLPDGTEQAVLLDAATAHLIAAGGLQPQTPLPLPLASAAYLAPDEAPDGRADLYGLGVLLFELLSGRLPLAGATAEDLARAHREQAPLRLGDAGCRVHPELEALLARLLAKDPAQRFASGDELAVILRALRPIAEEVPAVGASEESAPGAAAVEPAIPQPAPSAAAAEPASPQPAPTAEAVELAGSQPTLAPDAKAAEPAGPQLEPPAGQAQTASPLPAAMDSALERALLGEVPEQAAVESARQRPAWVARVAVAAAVALIAVAAQLARSGLRHDQRSEAASTPGSAGAGSAAKPPPSAFAKELEHAQKQLWTGRAAGAEATLRPLLSKAALPPRDRARASRMMGDAEAKQGNKASAAEWYGRALQLSTEPAERDRLERLIQAQRK